MFHNRLKQLFLNSTDKHLFTVEFMAKEKPAEPVFLVAHIQLLNTQHPHVQGDMKEFVRYGMYLLD